MSRFNWSAILNDLTFVALLLTILAILWLW